MSRLRVVRAKGKEASWCVIGAGHGGLAMAGHLGLLGYPVRLYNRTAEKLDGVRWHGGVKVRGAIEFLKVVRDAGMTARAIIAEAQTFLYASRALSRWESHIFRIKNAVPIATLPSFWTPEALGILNGAFPQFVAGTNVLATSLENIGAVFHPALTILNAGWIEATQGDFDYYLQGITPSVAKLLERIDMERLAIASAVGVRSVSAREWLYLSYDSPGKDLFETITNTESYRGIKAPPSVDHRCISEDVSMSLVPLSSLGAMLGIPTPTIDMIIQLGSILHSIDYRAVGRTVESLGLAGLTVKQIRGTGEKPPVQADGVDRLLDRPAGHLFPDFPDARYRGREVVLRKASRHRAGASGGPFHRRYRPRHRHVHREFRHDAHP